MDNVDDLIKEGSASDFGVIDAPDVDTERFAERLPASPEQSAEEEEDGEEHEETTPRGTWLDRPSIRDQAAKVPESVRMVDPTTVVLDLSDAKDLQEYNRIHKAAMSDAPTLAVIECERNFFQGRYSALVTYSKIQYQKI